MVDRSTLLKELRISCDPDFGMCLELFSWDHLDYIEDILAEYFDIEYEFKIQDSENSRYALLFGNSVEESILENALLAINRYHAYSRQLYVTM